MKISKTFIIILLVLSLTLMALPQPKPVRAATRWYVNANGGSDSNAGTSWATAFATLSKAQSVSAKGDEIWVAKGTYSGSSYMLSYSGLSYYGGFAGTETDINQRNISANETILSGGRHVVYINPYPSNETTIIDGFTITGGNANGSNMEMYGGGVFFRIDQSDGDTLILRRVKITGNHADSGGGGVAFGSVTGKFGTLIIEDSIISNNTSGISGSKYGNGGGVNIFSNSQVWINRTTFSNNNVYWGEGGAIYSVAETHIYNSTITNNTAEYYGGGIYLNNSSNKNEIYESTIVNNSAQDTSTGAGGIYSAGYAKFRNTIIANNTAPINPECYGTSPSITYSLVKAGGCGATNGVNGNITGVDPSLGPLQNNGVYNGVSTLSYSPLAGSPVIDAGDPSNYTNPDQRGVTRPH
jgi:hypothetical protein